MLRPEGECGEFYPWTKIESTHKIKVGSGTVMAEQGAAKRA